MGVIAFKLIIMRVNMKSMKLIFLEKLFKSIVKGHLESIDKKASRASFELQNKDSLVETYESMLIEIESLQKINNEQSTKGLSLQEKNFSLENKVNKLFKIFIDEDLDLRKYLKENKEREEIRTSLTTKSEEYNQDILDVQSNQRKLEEDRRKIDLRIENTKNEIDSLSKLLRKSQSDITYSKNSVLKLEDNLERKSLSLKLRESEFKIESKYLDEVREEVQRAQRELDELEASSIELKLNTEKVNDSQSENKKSLKETKAEILKLDVDIEESRCLFESEKGLNLELLAKVKDVTRVVNTKRDELVSAEVELCELKSSCSILNDKNENLAISCEETDNDLINTIRERKVLGRDLEKYDEENKSFNLKLNAQKEKLRSEGEDRDNLLNIKSEVISNLEESKLLLEKNDNELMNIKSQKETLRSLVDSKSIETSSLEDKNERALRKLSAIEKSNDDLSEVIDTLKARESKLEAKLEQVVVDLDELLLLNSDKKKEVIILEIDTSSLNVQLESINDQLEQVKAENDDVINRSELLNSKFGHVQMQVVEKVESIDLLESEISNRKVLITQKEDDSIILNKNINKLNIKQSELNAKRNHSSLYLTELQNEIEEKSKEYISLKELHAKKLASLKPLNDNNSQLKTSLSKVNKIVLDANEAIDKVSDRTSRLELSNDIQAKEFSSKNKELTKKKRLFKNLKEQYLINNERKIELENKNREVDKELSEIDILLRVENARGTTTIDNDALEDKNLELQNKLVEKRAELVELVDSQDKRSASRRITRNC